MFNVRKKISNLRSNRRRSRRDRWLKQYKEGLECSGLGQEEQVRAVELIEKLQVRDRKKSRIGNVLIVSSWILGGGGPLVTPVLVSKWSGGELIYDRPGLFLAYLVIWLILYLGAFAPLFRYSSYSPFILWYSLALVTSYAITVQLLARILTDASRQHRPIPEWQLLLANSFLGALVATVVSVVVLLLVFYWERRTDRRYAQQLPLGVIIAAFSKAIGRCTDWDDLRARSAILQSLEEAADAVEHGLTVLLKAGDDHTQDWLIVETRKRAAAIRMLKRPVCLPGTQSRIAVLRHCENTLRLALNGNLLDLPTQELVAEARRPEPLLIRARQIAQRLVTALVPLLVLIAVDIAGAPLEPPGSTYLWTAAIAWALIGIILVLDPAAREKGGFAKDLSEAVSRFRPGSTTSQK
jgi:hypothetical protein